MSAGTSTAQLLEALAGTGVEGVSAAAQLTSILQDVHQRTVSASVHDSVDPVSYSQQQRSALSKQYGPTVVQCLRTLSTRLAPGLPPSMYKQLGLLACTALDVLDSFKPELKASQQELELQRYSFVRKLAAVGQHELALLQGWKLYAAVWAQHKDSKARQAVTELQLAAVFNLVVCTIADLTQSPPKGCIADALLSVLEPLQTLLTELNCGDRNAETLKQSEAAYKHAYKCLACSCMACHAGSHTTQLHSSAIQRFLPLVVQASKLAHHPENPAEVLGRLAAANDTIHQLPALITVVAELAQGQFDFWKLMEPMVTKAVDSHRGQEAVQVLLRTAKEKKQAAAATYAMGADVLLQAGSSSTTTPAGMSRDMHDLVLSSLAGMRAKVQSHGCRALLQDRSLAEVWLALRFASKALSETMPGSASQAFEAGPATLHSWADVCLGMLQLLQAAVEHDAATDCDLKEQDPAISKVAQEAAPAASSAVKLYAAVLALDQGSSTTADLASSGLKQVLEAVPQLLGRLAVMGQALDEEDLKWLASCMTNTGLELMQAGMAKASGDVLYGAVQVSTHVLLHGKSSGDTSLQQELPLLLKKCKTLVSNLAKQELHAEAAARVVDCMACLAPLIGASAWPLLAPLVKQHVRSRLRMLPEKQLHSQLPPSSKASAPAGRKGRMNKMHATAAPDPSSLDAATNSVAMPPLTRALIDAARGSSTPHTSAPAAILHLVDLVAWEEVAVLQEECKGDAGKAVWKDTLVEELLGAPVAALPAEEQPILHASMALARHLQAPAASSDSIAALRRAASLLQPLLSSSGPNASGGADMECDRSEEDEVAALDVGAMCHAALAVALYQQAAASAQGDAASRGSANMDVTLHQEAVGACTTAAQLWGKLLQARQEGTAPCRQPAMSLRLLTQARQVLWITGAHGPQRQCDRVLLQLLACLHPSTKLPEGLQACWWLMQPGSCLVSRAVAPGLGASVAQMVGLGVPPSLPEEVLSRGAQLSSDSRTPGAGIQATAQHYSQLAALANQAATAQGSLAAVLLAAQCHQQAACAWWEAGDPMSASLQAQEALKLTSTAYHSISPLAAAPSASSPHAPAASPAAGGALSKDAHSGTLSGPSGAPGSAQHHEASSSDVGALLDQEGVSRSQVAVAEAGNNAATATAVGLEVTSIVLGMYAASLWQAAELYEACGMAEDALCLLRECGRMAGRLGAPGMQLLVCSTQAQVHVRQEDAGRAQERLQEVNSLATTGLLHDSQGYSLASWLQASGDLHRLRGDHSSAEQQYTAALQHVQNELQHRQQREAADQGCSGDGNRAWQWRLGKLQLQLQLSLAACLADQGRQAGALDLISQVSLHAMGASVSLPVPPAPVAKPAGRKGAAARGFSSAEGGGGPSGHSPASCRAARFPAELGAALLLEAQLKHASLLADIPGPDATGAFVRIAGLSGATSAAATSAATAEECQDGGGQDAPPKRKGVKPTRTTKAPAASKVLAPTQEAAPGHVTPSHDPSTVHAVHQLLRCCQLCWRLPLVLRAACRGLVMAVQSGGHVHAAAAFMHLSVGTSIWQQHVQAAQSRAADPGSAGTSSQVSDGAAGMVEQMLQCLEAAPFSAPVSSALHQLDRIAQQWLGTMHAALPAGTTITSIVQLPAGGVMLGRLVPERMPVLILVPSVRQPPLESQQPAGAHQVQAAHTKQKEAEQQQQPRGITQLLEELEGILQDSAASMAGGVAPSSQAQKVEWWKTRLSLDQRMSQLLTGLEQCLGPWRCLLQHVPHRLRPVLDDAAAAFAAENLGLGGKGAQQGAGVQAQQGNIVHEVLVSLMGLLPQLKPGEVQQAMQDMLQLLGRTGTGDATAMASRLLAAEAAACVGTMSLKAPAGNSSCSRSCSMVSGPAASSSGSSVSAALGPKEVCRRAAAGASLDPASSLLVRPHSPAGSTQEEGKGGREAAAAAVDAGGRGRRQLRMVAMKASGADKPAQPAPKAVTARGKKATELPSQAASSSNAAVPSESPAEEAAGAVGTKGKPARPQAAAKRAPATKRGAAAVASEAAVECVSAQAEHSQQPHLQRGAVAAMVSGLSDDAAAGFQGISSCDSCSSSGAVLLVLDARLHALPWESMPCMRGQQVYRSPCLQLTCSTAAALTARQGPMGQEPGRVQGQHAGSGGSSSGGPDEHQGAGPKPQPQPELNVASTFYLLNPGGDLLDTQQSFEPWFKSLGSWEGLSGALPPVRSLLQALKTHQLFMYFGHGSGEQYIPLSALRKLPFCAANLLMGCSSGRLRVQGSYDATGAVVAYCLAGAPSVVANLWDVTDRDIDRLCQALLAQWLGRQPGAQQGPAVSQPCSISGSLGSSRSACKLPHLIGAAPVCYGVPATVSWREE